MFTEVDDKEPDAGVPQLTPKSPLESIVSAITTCGSMQLVVPVDVSAGPNNPATARVVLVFELPSPQPLSPSSRPYPFPLLPSLELPTEEHRNESSPVKLNFNPFTASPFEHD